MALAAYLKKLEETDHVKIHTERLVRFEPVEFDNGILQDYGENGRKKRPQPLPDDKRRRSGCPNDGPHLPTAMIFVPSVKGISHNPKEYTVMRTSSVAPMCSLILLLNCFLLKGKIEQRSEIVLHAYLTH